jgi:glyoxylase-like metal-dependent hydrolase (beta-lactamase superfamily II)
MKTGQSAVVDAPAEASFIIESLKGTKPQFLLLTHDHYDHTGVLVSLRTRLKVPLGTHELSSFQLKTPPEILLKDGDIIKLGELMIKVIFTPGHTPGSLCFLVGKYLLAGDTLFPGGPGHTETPEDFESISASITQKIYSLPGETLILPGHGDSITVEKSKEEYAAFASKTHDPLCGDVAWLTS